MEPGNNIHLQNDPLLNMFNASDLSPRSLTLGATLMQMFCYCSHFYWEIIRECIHYITSGSYMLREWAKVGDTWWEEISNLFGLFKWGLVFFLVNNLFFCCLFYMQNLGERKQNLPPEWTEPLEKVNLKAFIGFWITNVFCLLALLYTLTLVPLLEAFDGLPQSNWGILFSRPTNLRFEIKPCKLSVSSTDTRSRAGVRERAGSSRVHAGGRAPTAESYMQPFRSLNKSTNQQRLDLWSLYI